MAIEVRHDIGGKAIASGAALAGAGLGALKQWEAKRRAGEIIVQNDAAQSRQLTALNAQKQMQEQSIQAHADLQRQSAAQAADRVALQAGLGQKMQEERFDHELRAIHEGAKAKAQQFDYEYTAGQKREFAKLNQARQAVMNSAAFTGEEKAAAIQQIEMRQAGIEPSMMPRPSWKQTYPEGRGPMDTWIDEQSGGLVALDRSGNPRQLVPPDKMPEYLKEKAQVEQREAEADRQAKRGEKLLDLRMKLATEDIVEGSGEEVTRRKRRSDEVEEIMQTIAGGEAGGQRQVNWWDQAASNGIEVSESEKALPEQVGFASAYLRAVNDKFGIRGEDEIDKLPLELHPAYFSATQVLREFHKRQRN